jgi:tryptophanyl-tRNA synthetase
MNFLTGIKPTGTVHLGNYLGAIRPALDLVNQQQGDFFYFIADFHALTAIGGLSLKEVSYQVAATWLALGLDPDKVFFYRQSDIDEIFQLSWILSCFTPKGDLNRAHAYKAAEGKEVNAGLYTYPILMAADILLFKTDFVPVGKDQAQHLEMARAIASRINQSYGEILKLPQSMINDDVGTIVGTDGNKMSKSLNNTIPLFCDDKGLQKLITKIKTDSTILDGPKDPDTSIIFFYYKFFATAEEIETFRDGLEGGLSWGAAKDQLYRAMNKELAPYRARYSKLMEDKRYLEEVLMEGANKVRPMARENLEKIKAAVLGS